MMPQYSLRSKYASFLIAARQCQPHIPRNRIDGFALRAPIGMIDAVPLIMTM